MEYLEGFERAFGLYSHSSLILLVAQINKPEDLEGMVKKMRLHLSRYPRCNSSIVHIRSSVFAKFITNAEATKYQVRVHDEALS